MAREDRGEVDVREGVSCLLEARDLLRLGQEPVCVEARVLLVELADRVLGHVQVVRVEDDGLADLEASDTTDLVTLVRDCADLVRGHADVGVLSHVCRLLLLVNGPK